MSELLPCAIDTTSTNWRWVFPEPVRTRFAAHLAFDDSRLAEEPDRAAILRAMRGARVVLATWSAIPLDAELLDQAPDLALVLYAAGTVKGLVTEELARRRIPLVSAARANAVPVAEFVLGVILASLKNLTLHRGALAEQGPEGWNVDKVRYDGGYFHTIVGIVGDGLVARHLLELLRLFSMEVLIASDYFTAEDEARYGARRAPLEEVMRSADVVTVHHADIPRYWNLINRQNLALMRPGSRFINTSRGRIVNEEDLVERLREGDITAFLDVTYPEPPHEGHPFYTLPNCVLTPHVAGSIGREVERMSLFCLEQLERWLRGAPLEGLVDYERLAERA